MADKLTKEQAILVGEKARQDLACFILNGGHKEACEAVLSGLRELGKQIGYAPAFRILVMDESPRQAIRWS